MKTVANSLKIFILVFLGNIFHLSYYYSFLPEEVATHFNAAGLPDSWSSKTTLVGIYAGVAVLTFLTFWGLTYLLPRLSHSFINLPRKEYWLAAERKQATLKLICDRLQYLGMATLVFLGVIFHLTFRVNLAVAERLQHVWWITGSYLGVTFLWIISLVKKFNKIPRD
ncbi:MAG: DUF1648 domain-containing protein [bacterium]